MADAFTNFVNENVMLAGKVAHLLLERPGRLMRARGIMVHHEDDACQGDDGVARDLDCDLKSAYVTEIVGSTGPREPDVHTARAIVDAGIAGARTHRPGTEAKREHSGLPAAVGGGPALGNTVSKCWGYGHCQQGSHRRNDERGTDSCNSHTPNPLQTPEPTAP